MNDSVQYLKRDGKAELAYIYTPAQGDGKALPTVMFCGGFKSDMMGTKANYFEEQCKARGQAYLRFDYSGHGMSGGNFKDGTIGAWFEDTLAIFDALVNGPVVIAGSSMGGWIGLLLARARSQYVKGYIGIAAGPDFTGRLYDEEFNDEQRAIIDEQGYLEVPNTYSDDPYYFSKALIEEGKNHYLLQEDQTHDYPIILFHGRLDDAVPEKTPLTIQKRYSGAALEIVFIDDGDHRLSSPTELTMIDAAIVKMSEL